MQEIGVISRDSGSNEVKVRCGCFCDSEKQAEKVHKEISLVIADYIPKPTMNDITVRKKDVVIMVQGECRDTLENLKQAINTALSKF